MRQLLHRAWHLIRRRRFDADLREELAFHEAAIERELEDRGTNPTAVHVAARRIIGSVALAQDQARDVWTPRWLQGLGHDIRVAVRSLRATPTVTAIAVLSLTLGIGANAAIFSLVNSLLLRTLPVRAPDRLVLLADSTSNLTPYWRYPVWEQIQQRPELFESATGWNLARFDLATDGDTQSVDGVWASGSYFDTLGVHAVLGRTFSVGDDRPNADAPVMVISYGLWQRRFGGTADVLGRQVPVNGVRVSIVGVTPPDFFGTFVGGRSDVFLPEGEEPLVNHHSGRSELDLFIIGRLKSGQTNESATAAIRASGLPRGAMASSDDPYLRDYLARPFTLLPAASGLSDLRRLYVRPLGVILGAAGLVLLVSCVNVANLLLARAAARRHDVSVRLALGASRWRLVRAALIESVLLAGAAAALGTLIASWGSQLLIQQLSTRVTPLFLDLSPDWRVLAFAFGLALATLVVCGVVPALRASAVAPMEALRAHGIEAAGQPRARLGDGLMVAEVALSVMLVATGGLFIQTFASLTHRDLGFSRNEILVVVIDGRRAITDPLQRLPVYERVRDAIRALPGVANAALANLSPVSNVGLVPPIDVSGTGPLSASERVVYANMISPDWFQTFGIPLIEGRDLAETDRAGAPVAVVNQAFVHRFLRDGRALDHTITLPTVITAPGRDVFRIVGLVADAVYLSPRESPNATVYLPLGQHDEPWFIRTLESVNLNVRAANGVPPAQLTKSVAAAIARINPQLTVTARPLADQVSDSLARERVLAILAGFFAILALALAALGLYGVTSYAVNRRRTEVGIRMPLGATASRVVGLIMSRLMALSLLGITLGIVGEFWISTALASLLYGVTAHDTTTLTGAMIVLTMVTAIAAAIPAWRACRIDPASVLRNE